MNSFGYKNRNSAGGYTYGQSKSWHLRNKLMAVTLLLSEMDIYDRQTCDMCQHCRSQRAAATNKNCRNKNVVDANGRQNEGGDQSVGQHVVKTIENNVKKKLIELETKRTTADANGNDDNMQIFENHVTTTSGDKMRCVPNKVKASIGYYAPVHKSTRVIGKENVWLLQEQVSRISSSPSSPTISDADSGLLTGSDSSEYVTAPSKSLPTAVMKVSSV